jgi:hypothetical protein|tara:strand:+ start:7411 stop:7614 length:204 start_codon:yes stop_codon:yes gene_type:complete
MEKHNTIRYAGTSAIERNLTLELQATINLMSPFQKAKMFTRLVEWLVAKPSTLTAVSDALQELLYEK